jgi:hypothetical protein
LPITLNLILREAGLPLNEVCLLRHQDNRAKRGCTPYELWRDNRPAFDLYQSHQQIARRLEFSKSHWASFVGTPDNETLFVGVYEAKYKGLLDHDRPKVHMDGIDPAGSCDVYDLTLVEPLRDLIGRLLIEWGPGARAWVQRADRKDKPIKELRVAFKEPDFPGFLNFVEPLSRLKTVPKGWIAALQSSRGIYFAHLPQDQRAVCRFGNWRARLLGAVAELSGYRPRR